MLEWSEDPSAVKWIEWRWRDIWLRRTVFYSFVEKQRNTLFGGFPPWSYAALGIPCIIRNWIKEILRSNLRRNTVIELRQQFICIVKYIFLLLCRHGWWILERKNENHTGDLSAVNSHTSWEYPCRPLSFCLIANEWQPTYNISRVDTYISWPASLTIFICSGNVSRLWPAQI